MKGITPIISIIMLLLITVSLAGAAYVFLSGYILGPTGKTVSVIGACAGNTEAALTVTNMGSQPIVLGAAAPRCSVTGYTAQCGDVTVIKSGTNALSPSADFNTNSIAPSDGTSFSSALFTDGDCSVGVGNYEVCKYSVSTPGMVAPAEVTISCRGN